MLTLAIRTTVEESSSDKTGVFPIDRDLHITNFLSRCFKTNKQGKMPALGSAKTVLLSSAYISTPFRASWRWYRGFAYFFSVASLNISWSRKIRFQELTTHRKKVKSWIITRFEVLSGDPFLIQISSFLIEMINWNQNSSSSSVFCAATTSKIYLFRSRLSETNHISASDFFPVRWRVDDGFAFDGSLKKWERVNRKRRFIGYLT